MDPLWSKMMQRLEVVPWSIAATYFSALSVMTTPWWRGSEDCGVVDARGRTSDRRKRCAEAGDRRGFNLSALARISLSHECGGLREMADRRVTCMPWQPNRPWGRRPGHAGRASGTDQDAPETRGDDDWHGKCSPVHKERQGA
ncbi:hypothetical protein GCM10014715_14920 [Streptomyces spiralis]|uniref:Uncharacterized protein n=1 Tax=Streptomyces spiralis TaxID=66376 RepID=A0A918ZPW9_9ACTN|nr:hypothetical protein GCM10014715_14920 [Streptomyces spiralis]